MATFSSMGRYFRPSVYININGYEYGSPCVPHMNSTGDMLYRGMNVAPCGFCGHSQPTIKNRNSKLGYPAMVICDQCASPVAEHPTSMKACTDEWNAEQAAIVALRNTRCCGQSLVVKTAYGKYSAACDVCRRKVSGTPSAQNLLHRWKQNTATPQKKEAEDPVEKHSSFLDTNGLEHCARCGRAPNSEHPWPWCGHCHTRDDHHRNLYSAAASWETNRARWNQEQQLTRKKQLRDGWKPFFGDASVLSGYVDQPPLLVRPCACGKEYTQNYAIWPTCKNCKVAASPGDVGRYVPDRRTRRTLNIQAWNEVMAKALAKKATPQKEATPMTIKLTTELRPGMSFTRHTKKDTNPCGETRRDNMENIKTVLNATNMYAAGAMKAGAKQVVGMKAQKAIMAQVQTLLGDHFPAEFYATPLGKAVLDLGCCYAVNAVSNAFPAMPGADTVRDYSANAMAGVTAENLSPLMEMAESLLGGIAAEATKLGLAESPKAAKKSTKK